VNEINEKTDLEIKWEPVKKGRAVTGVKFFIRTSVQSDLFGK
jgi:plasmid replication initiation protein